MTTGNNKEDLELEEGEIAEDSNDASLDDSGDDDNLTATNSYDKTLQPGSSGLSNNPTTDTQPQKKRKKVVRKVRRKIKVKRKVSKKKGGAGGGVAGAGAGGAANPAGGPSSGGLGQTHNGQLDSLWEQQILMLQQQQNDQILRAAATDEDLRILFTPQQPYQRQQQPQNQPQTQHQPPTQHQHQQQTQSQPQPQHQHQPQSQSQLQPAQQQQPKHQTPSSPDDENGKSSYEAISKMLALLRNSANVTDTSEHQSDHHLQSSILDNENCKQLSGLDEAKGRDYVLVPILVDGIDYTKYKLLSQYEPKFKNDPRLNQHT